MLNGVTLLIAIGIAGYAQRRKGAEKIRAVQGEACSGFITSPALVTQEGLAKLGDSNQFDPDMPYRAAYTALWGK